jgi:hypothetical protein
MNLVELENLIKEVIEEEQDYQRLFKSMLDASGKDINSMSDADKKKFFTAVDKAYKAKSEGKLRGYNEDLKKKSLDESFIVGLISLMTVAIIGKIIFYFFVQLVDKGMKYVSSNDKNLEAIVKKILKELSDNKSFIEDVTNMINKNKGIDQVTAGKILKMGYTQDLIKKYNSKEDFKNSDIENELKNIFYKSWADSNVVSNISDKIKNDIK